MGGLEGLLGVDDDAGVLEGAEHALWFFDGDCLAGADEFDVL